MRNRYKVLRPLTEIALFSRGFGNFRSQELLGYKVSEIAPRFTRDGTYFDRDLQEAWVEYKGRAYMIPKQRFDQKYKVLCAPAISVETYYALHHMHGINKYLKHEPFHEDCVSNSFARPVFRYQLEKLRMLGWYW
jgi:hypothetical protein